MREYLLGCSDHELGRLALQQEVWSEATESFLDALSVRPGARVVDVGCGPGFVVPALRARVGAEGRVTAVDESQRWIEHLRGVCDRERWTNVTAVRSRVQELELETGAFDLVFMRWVLSFLPEHERIVARLASLLRPGGVFALMDYNHEGVSLFPESEGFRAAVRATRSYYAESGGNAWIIGGIRRTFRAAGLEPTVFAPYVVAGPPSSPAFRWADAFFPHHLPAMVDKGHLTAEEERLFQHEWAERRADPDAVFFSPIVVGAAARKAAERS
jgi:SAM-dependent methyltransferase